ncbi:unnamed protein product [Nezara viridula]|uniref:Uncharacterized protein n=1 Tax=Nezara viridula TaxID=85310 RepID=A0A9P0HPI2_NEZVI|nr:unnamed protein product [Nezara viridula]
MILQRHGYENKNNQMNTGDYRFEKKVKLMDVEEWRKLISGKYLNRISNKYDSVDLKGLDLIGEDAERMSCQKRFSLVLKSTSRAGTTCGRLRNEVAISAASDLEGVAKGILTTSGQDTNFQLTLKDGKGNSLTLAWTHIDPEETEARQNKKKDSRMKVDEGIAKKRQLVEGDFKQWLVTKLAKTGTS